MLWLLHYDCNAVLTGQMVTGTILAATTTDQLFQCTGIDQLNMLP